ncbi:MAG TPA: MFS transporter, partial [Streptomyces sp.]|nr:MFS transporter [Streptomyces sp.]
PGGSPEDAPSVGGVVRAAGGGPVPRAAVTLISLSGRQIGRTVASPDGAYTLDAPGAGSYVLIASAEGHQPQASTVLIAGQPLAHDLMLSGTSGLAGTVRSAEDSRPVTDAMVVVTDVRGDVLAAGRTGGTGGFGFDDLVAGSYTVAVNAPGFRPLAQPVEIGEHGTSRVALELRTGAEVRGTVRAGSRNEPLPDARVTLIDAAGDVVATATTGSDGAYAFADLDTGDYTVIASGYPPVANSLAVTGRGVDDYDIALAHSDE